MLVLLNPDVIGVTEVRVGGGLQKVGYKNKTVATPARCKGFKSSITLRQSLPTFSCLEAQRITLFLAEMEVRVPWE